MLTLLNYLLTYLIASAVHVVIPVNTANREHVAVC